MSTQAEIQQTVSGLNASIWAYSALTFSVETGILEQLTESRSLQDISEKTHVPVTLVERLLDVLAALGLLQREGNTFIAESNLLPLVTPPAKSFFLANSKVNYLGSLHLITSALEPGKSIGWSFTEPEILQSTGNASAG